MPSLPDNPPGYFERNDIVDIHERIFQALDTAWDTSFALPEGWHRSAEVAPLRAELLQLVRVNFAHRPLWAWKDPRTTVLFPLWKDVLGELGIALSCLLVTRHPLDVAKSLERRDGFPVAEGVTIWLNYNLAMLESTTDVPRAFVSYDHLVEDWKSALAKCSKVLPRCLDSVSEETRQAVENAIRKDLRHSVSPPEDLVRAGCPAPVRELVGIIDNLSRNSAIEPTVEQRLRELIDTHVAASHLYRHDIRRAVRKTRSAQRHAANLENVKSRELREQTRLLEKSQALSKDVERMSAANEALNREIRRLRVQLQERNRNAKAAERRQASIQASLEQHRRQSKEQEEEIRLLRGSLEQSCQDVKKLQARVNDLCRSLAERDEHLRQALSQVKLLAKALDDVYASQSWRITKPLRAIYARLFLSSNKEA